MNLSLSRRHNRYFLIAPLLMAMALPAHAVQQDNPKFFVESAEYRTDCPNGVAIADPGIRGGALTDPRFTLNIRVDIAYPFPHGCNNNHILSGTQAADEVVRRITTHPTHSQKTDSIVIELVRLGNVEARVSGYESGVVKLFYHPEDGLHPTWAPFTPNGMQTPWKSKGIAATRSWMQQFITRYKQHQHSNPSMVKAPIAFVFDNEIGIAADPYVYLFMKNDPLGRWATEVIPGIGKTMAQLEADYRRSSTVQTNSNAGNYNIYRPFDYHNSDYANNMNWYMWYGNITRQAISGATKEAVYDLVEAAWPGVKTSNYGYYTTDGVYDPERDLMRVSTVHDLRDGAWDYGATKAYENMAAPLFYGPWVTIGNTKAEQIDSYERYMRHQIESILYSYGGFNPTNINPWIMLQVPTSGYVYNLQNRALTQNGVIHGDRDWHRAALALFRSFQIDKINLFSPVDPPYNTTVLQPQWDDFYAVVNQVWAYDMELAVKGTANTQVSPQILSFAGNGLILDSGSTTQVVARFLQRSTVPQPNALRIYTESHGVLTGGQVASVVSVQRRNGTWLELNAATAMPSAEKRWLQSFDVPGATSDYVQNDGRIAVRVQHRPVSGSGTISSKFETVLLIGTDGTSSGSNALMSAPPPPPPANHGKKSLSTSAVSTELLPASTGIAGGEPVSAR